ncbi:MAG: MFS transporter [Acidimicrobiales bacterium]
MRRVLEPVPARSWLALSLAALTFLVISITLTGTNIAFPAITAEFSETSRATLSWALSGYSIALATFMVPAGRLSDRRGRRTMFFAGVWIFLLSSLVCVASPNATVFVAARVVQGIGGSLTVPTSLALVLPAFPVGRRASAVAAWTASGTVGAAIAPSLSAAIVEHVGWRYVYLIAVPATAAVLIWGRSLLPSAQTPVTGDRLDFIGLPMGTVAIGLIALVIVQGSSWGWTHPAILGAMIGAVVLLPLFIVRSLRHPAPLLDLRVFAKRQVWTATAAGFVLSMLGASTWVVWPLFLTEIWDYSLVQAGLAITPAPVCASAFGLIGGQLADRFGRGALIRIGSFFPLASMLIMAFAWGPEPRYLTAYLPSIILFGTGFGLTFSSLNAAALEGQTEEMFGEVNAGFNTVRNLSAGLGVAAAVALLGERDAIAFEAFDRFFFVFALVGALPSLIINGFYPRTTT